MGLGPQFEQLSMFMTPRQIMEDYAPLEGDRLVLAHANARQEYDEEVWERKAVEATMPRGVYRRVMGIERKGTNTEFSADRAREEETSLTDSIRTSGVQMPVRVGPTQVTGGHHRIAAAHSINPDMLIPVLHEPEDMPIRSNKAYPYT